MDIIIVGAGPVGLYLANLLEKKLDVLVLDKNPDFGKKADSGLYSTKISDFIPVRQSWIDHEVSSARLHSPTGQVIEMGKPATAAYVCDREKFTASLANRVKSKILLKATVNRIDISDSVTVETSRGKYEAHMVVGCDGASSVVRKHFLVKPDKILNGVIAIKKEPNKDSQVDLYFDKSLIKDGFFWKIPRGETTEYGALGTNVNYSYLETFFKIKDYEKRAAFMNLGLFKTYFPRAILVGEAAGQVKPWSLGGIIFGFTCAQIASEIIFEAFDRNDFSESFLKRYDDSWKKKIGKTIRTGIFFREMFEKMDNDSLERYFKKVKMLPYLSRLDMDFPSLELFG